MIGRDSRYARCVLYRDSDGTSLGMRQRIDTTPRYDDRLHTVVEGDRLDLLAHRYLGDARLWWIICDYNDLFFPLALEPAWPCAFPLANTSKCACSTEASDTSPCLPVSKQGTANRRRYAWIWIPSNRHF